MPAYQSRLLISLFASSVLSTAAFADTVLISTTTDENNINNQSCSLREAVAYLSAKNAKKALIDAEVAEIAGTSVTLRSQFLAAQQELALEQAKPSPDATKVAQLNSTISALGTRINAGIFSLNSQLNSTQDNLTKEKNKPTPDAALIASYEASITQLKTDIQSKNDQKTAKETEMKNFRQTGQFGCVSTNENNSDNISLLTLPTAYTIDAPITLNFSISLIGTIIETSDGSTRPLEESTLALPLRPIIKANGNHALFIIDDGIVNSASDLPMPVTIQHIDLMGCEQSCATNGGLILNKESLFLSDGIFSKGQATLGGAIYNEEKAALNIKRSIFRDNQASNGAAIYSAQNNLTLENLLVTNNKVTNSSHGIIAVNSSTTHHFGSINVSSIGNSTFSANEGAAISAHGDILFNNNTIVNNTIGIHLNNTLPLIYNSIIAGNTQADCEAFATLPVDTNIYFANNLSVQNKGCPSPTGDNNQFISNTGDQTLLASLDSNNRCAAPPAVGLLCPLGQFGGLTKTHKPRLLASYTHLDDSPIVNKGFFKNISNIGIACLPSDQRGLLRENAENRCDIGAVEVQTGLLTYKQGDDIVFGQVKRFNPSENLSDAELLPAAHCEAMLGAGTYLNGCIKLVDNPKHGTVQFDPQTGEVLYSTSNPNFHGFDQFSYSIVTTLSRFSDAKNDRTLQTNVRVVSEPPASLESKALDNGSINFFSLLILSGLLAMWRRPR